MIPKEGEGAQDPARYPLLVVPEGAAPEPGQQDPAGPAARRVQHRRVQGRLIGRLQDEGAEPGPPVRPDPGIGAVGLR